MEDNKDSPSGRRGHSGRGGRLGKGERVRGRKESEESKIRDSSCRTSGDNWWKQINVLNKQSVRK